MHLSTISTQDQADFAKNLSVMLRCGISVNDALTSIGEQQSSGRFKAVILRMRDRIENGTPLSVAFEKESKTFGTISVSLVKAGEQSGTLQKNLQFLAELLERSSDLKREISSATLYPKLVFGVAVALGGGLAVFILPRLTPLFSSLNIELPLVTRMLIALSTFIREYWIVTLAVIMLGAVLIFYLATIPRVRRILDHMTLRLPIFGRLVRNYQIALVAQLFATLLKSGIPIVETTGIVSASVTNLVYREALEKVERGLVGGTMFSESITAFHKTFPTLAINIIAVGEQSGTLSDSFEYLAEFYTKEVSTQAKKLPVAIEPLLLTVIAAVVGFVALAVIMPIYELTGNLSR